MSHIGWGGEQITLYKGVKTLRGHWPRRGVDCDVSHWLGRRINHHLQGCENLTRTLSPEGGGL